MEQNENAADTANTWTLTVDEEGLLVLPDELWDALGWKEGDELEWVDQADGSYALVKVTEEPTQDN